MKKYVENFMQYQFLLSELVKKGIKLKYRRSYLGIVWSLLEPLLTMIVLTIVFGVLFNYVIFLISLVVLALVSIILGVKPTHYLWQAAVALILILFIAYGCGMILATIGVFFRDMEYLWSVALMMVMYTCAIFYYPSKLLKSGWAWILKYNPLYCVIDIFRCAVFGQPMNMQYVAYAVAFAVGSMLIGLLCFKKKQDDFILYI